MVPRFCENRNWRSGFQRRRKVLVVSDERRKPVNGRRDRDNCDDEHEIVIKEMERRLVRIIVTTIIAVTVGFIFIADARVDKNVPPLIQNALNEHRSNIHKHQEYLLHNLSEELHLRLSEIEDNVQDTNEKIYEIVANGE